MGDPRPQLVSPLQGRSSNLLFLDLQPGADGPVLRTHLCHDPHPCAAPCQCPLPCVLGAATCGEDTQTLRNSGVVVVRIIRHGVLHRPCLMIMPAPLAVCFDDPIGADCGVHQHSLCLYQGCCQITGQQLACQQGSVGVSNHCCWLCLDCSVCGAAHSSHPLTQTPRQG